MTVPASRSRRPTGRDPGHHGAAGGCDVRQRGGHVAAQHLVDVVGPGHAQVEPTCTALPDLGEAANDPERASDRLSARYLIALAARIVREVGDLARRAERQDKRLATLALDTEISFRSAEERAAFTDELSGAVTALVGRYHDPSAEDSRPHRLVVAAHPLPAEPEPEEQGR